MPVCETGFAGEEALAGGASTPCPYLDRPPNFLLFCAWLDFILSYTVGWKQRIRCFLKAVRPVHAGTYFSAYNNIPSDSVLL